jgi:hypothetical protein
VAGAVRRGEAAEGPSGPLLRSSAGRWLQVRRQAFGGLREIAFADDVVAVKHAPRFVAQERHRHALRHVGPHEISRSRAATVVKMRAS